MVRFRALRRELEEKTLKDDVLIGLLLMIDQIRNRNYRDAMDSYLKICVGNR
jgi:uncharacterized protein (DUF924 family)